MSGPSVRWRSGGHILELDSDVLRFEVADINRVITNAVANSDLYRTIQTHRGHPDEWQLLTLSCFAVTTAWTPTALAAETGFHSYRLARATTLTDAGYELWPTEGYIDNVADPRNNVHYDLVVAAGPALSVTKLLIPASIGPAELAAGRAYAHDAELDADESLTIGTRIEIRDDAGRMFAATATGRDGQRWQLTIGA